VDTLDALDLPPVVPEQEMQDLSKSVDEAMESSGNSEVTIADITTKFASSSLK
jgi:hypothetical protein